MQDPRPEITVCLSTLNSIDLSVECDRVQNEIDEAVRFLEKAKRRVDTEEIAGVQFR